MFKKITKSVLNIDQFSFNPESSLIFNKKTTYSTYPGGVMSITLGLVFAYTWYSQLYEMFNYLNNNISTYTTVADFDKIGMLLLDDIKAIPFYAFFYKN